MVQGLVVCRAIPARGDLAVRVLFVFLPGEYVQLYYMCPPTEEEQAKSNYLTVQITLITRLVAGVEDRGQIRPDAH